jgi:hypothetical protein
MAQPPTEYDLAVAAFALDAFDAARRCDDCKNWNNAMFGDWGECSRMRSDKDHHPVDGDTWAHSEGANGTVTTAPDFSCIMFQPKKEQL